MQIDGVNSAMTALQFAQARSSSRTVEMSAATTTSRGDGRSPATTRAAREPAAPSPERFVMPATFHWGYRPTVVNGKRAAKRTPQFADSTFWSLSLNRLA